MRLRQHLLLQKKRLVRPSSREPKETNEKDEKKEQMKKRLVRPSSREPVDKNESEGK
jgi:hypothetical protein